MNRKEAIEEILELYRRCGQLMERLDSNKESPMQTYRSLMLVRTGLKKIINDELTKEYWGEGSEQWTEKK